MSYEYGYLSNAFFWIPVAACFTPYIALSSIGDYKVRRVDKVLSVLHTRDPVPILRP